MQFFAGLGSDDPCADGPSNPAYDPAICAAVAPGTLPAQSFDPTDSTPDLGDLMSCSDGSIVSVVQGCPRGATPTSISPPTPQAPSKTPGWLYALGAILVAGAGGVAYHYHRTHTTKAA